MKKRLLCFSAYQISSQLFFTMNPHSPCRGNPLSLQGQGKRIIKTS